MSRKFYEKFTKPAPIRTGLNQTINAYNATLENTKSRNNMGFGDIYHATICPFCLQYEQRENGCAYMGHDNPKHLDSTKHPYCQKNFVVEELRDKYLRLGRRLDPYAPDHLEFCVECGRPCWHHQHFKLDGSGFEPNRLVGEEGRRHIDYGTCTGGGRAELFARILAIRDVYANKNIKKPKEERRAAAMLADESPKNAAIMERAKKIFSEESSKRKWNASIPKKKSYNNVAYQENDQEGGKKKHKTRKIRKNKRKSTRKTIS